MDILACLSCRQPQLETHAAEVVCAHCSARYPVFCGAIDFRDADRDVSAGFDIDEDNLLASKMSEVFEETSTFNEMLQLLLGFHSRKAKGIDFADIDPRTVIREDRIEPRPFSAADEAHAQAILEKLPLYLESTDFPPLRKGIALEDGAGHGYFTDGFARHFDHVFVLDLSMAYLMLARKIVEERRLTNVTLVCASVERLPFRDEAFDFIHNNNVIEHVARQDLLMSEAHRVLKTTGLLVVVSPNRFSLYFEPHFRLPGFGFIPKPISRAIIRKRQNRDISEIALRSLGEVKALARRSFGTRFKASFIPRRLEQTITGGRIRGFLTAALGTPVVGSAIDFFINKAALGVMPYHVLLCAKPQPTETSRP